MLSQVPGVVEHGLFVDIAGTAILGLPDGGVELRDASGTVRTEPPAEAEDGLFDDLPD